MKAPRIPENEEERLKALRFLEILDTAPEGSFDRITRIAQQAFHVPIALFALVDADRQWFKSKQGVSVSEMPREISFCGHTIVEDQIFIVEDTLLDNRFFDNPLVTNEPYIRFYAGIPVKTPNNMRIGTLCLVDTKPTAMNENEKNLLYDFGQILEREIRDIFNTQQEIKGHSF